MPLPPLLLSPSLSHLMGGWLLWLTWPTTNANAINQSCDLRAHLKQSTLWLTASASLCVSVCVYIRVCVCGLLDAIPRKSHVNVRPQKMTTKSKRIQNNNNRDDNRQDKTSKTGLGVCTTAACPIEINSMHQRHPNLDICMYNFKRFPPHKCLNN